MIGENGTVKQCQKMTLFNSAKCERIWHCLTVPNRTALFNSAKCAQIFRAHFCAFGTVKQCRSIQHC